MKLSHHLLLVVFIILCIGITNTITAQEGPPEHVRKAIQSVEHMLKSESDSAIEQFIDESMVLPEMNDRSSVFDHLKNIRQQVPTRWNDINVTPQPEGIQLSIVGYNDSIYIDIALEEDGIHGLRLADPPEPITLSRNNLDETFAKLESEGMAGIAYVQLNGKVFLKKGFGMANKQLEIPNTISTIFGVGSRPIDFTKAAIYLLEQRGNLDQDNTIDHYLNNVPADKASMTLRHLMTGQSGLPDFFHTAEDWDPDLQWIDREKAVNRLLNQQLLFEPGKDRQHSHGAFVLLAALVEKISGQSYFDFLYQNFFEPAEMNHTNEYGKISGHKLTDFAVGAGPQKVGIPNIPPNWGPTSWLIKGSGGMYSNLDNLLKFYDYVRSDALFEAKYRKQFKSPTVNLDGSVRGFELFNIYHPSGNQAYIFLNDPNNTNQVRELFKAMERLILKSEK
ncbi:serine hydrolase domain-containing protein [Fodinibius saliphilus]|uniref:serine hydrolase domain-containing protein n=1 Tax=Fodinibius saliphilus TaxID=1920650 RepID=UPI001108CF95|nr:serine hydrolase domain-containing protein [Fodinibius saliphilus]